MSFLSKFKFTGNKKKVVNNVFWAMLGKSLNVLNGLFVGILVARYLGPEQYGLMSYIVSYVSIFSILASFGMDNIVIRELSKQNKPKEAVIGTAFRLKLLFAIGTVILIFSTLLAFESDTYTTIMTMVYSLSIIANSLSVIRHYFTSIVLNQYVVKSEISRTLMGAAIKIILLLLRAPLEFFIIAVTFDFILLAGGYSISYKRKVGRIKDWSYDKEIAKHLIMESFPLLLSGAAVIIYQKIDQVMIGKLLNHEEVGYFATAGRFTELILFLPTIMTQTITPLLVRERENNPERYQVKKQRFVSIVVWISIIISASVSFLSYWFIVLSFGEKYLASVPVLQILAWKAVGMALSSSSGQLIIIERIHKYAFIRNIVGAVICIVLNYFLIPSFGIKGSAWVTLITVFFTGCFANILIPPYHKIFVIQLKALFFGWKEFVNIKGLLK